MSKCVRTAVLTLAALACSAASIAAQQSVRVGIYHNPPKILINETGQPGGFHVELLNAIAAANGWQIEYVPGTWTELLVQTERGAIDIMPDVALSSGRLNNFSFNEESVFTSWGVVYTSRRFRPQSLSDLQGRRLASMRGSIHTTGETGIVSLLASLNIEADVVRVPDYESAFELVARGEADAAVVNRLFGATFAADSGLISSPVVFNPVSIRYALPPDGERTPELIRALDRQLRALKSDPQSVYFALVDQYLAVPEPAAFLTPGWIIVLLVVSAAAVVALTALTLMLNQQVRIRKRAEAVLAGAQAEIVQAEKLRSLRTLLAGVSHELNNPTNYIKSSVGGLRADLSDLATNDMSDEERAVLRNEVGALLNGIEEGARRITGVAGALRAYVREESDALVSVDPVAEVERAISTMQTEIPEAISVVVDLHRVPSVECRPTDIGFVVVELLSNALDALSGITAPHERRIEISVRSAEHARRRAVILEVSDTGCGMNEETLERAFDPFYTTSTGESGASKGLGLSICYDTVTRLGGTIRVSSKPGVGTTMTVSLPVR